MGDEDPPWQTVQKRGSGKNPLSTTAPSFTPTASEGDARITTPGLFRTKGNMLTNHFPIQFGKATELWESSLDVVKVFPAPTGQNSTLIRRVKRRAVYIFAQELMNGPTARVTAVNPSAPGNAPAASGSQAQKTTTQPKDVNSQTPIKSSDGSDVPTQSNAQTPSSQTPSSSGGESQSDPNRPKKIPGDIKIASDYNNTLITLKPIPREYLGRSFLVLFNDDWEEGPGANPIQFRVTITGSTRTDILRTVGRLANPGPSPVTVADRNSFLQALNITLSHKSNLGTFKDIPRHRDQTTALSSSKKFFDLTFRHPLTNGTGQPPWHLTQAVDALPGYFVSSRAVVNGRLLLNVNTMTSAFYKPFQNGNLADLMHALNTTLGRPSQRELQSHLKGIRVETNYLRNGGSPHEKRFTITGLPDLHNRSTAQNTDSGIVTQTAQGPRPVRMFTHFNNSKF